MFIFSGDNYQVEMLVEELNGEVVDFKSEYKDLNNKPAKEFIKKFVNEVLRK